VKDDERMWRSAVQGAITSFVIGLANVYVFATPNASLQVGPRQDHRRFGDRRVHLCGAGAAVGSIRGIL
jgi:hypothetical protein